MKEEGDGVFSSLPGFLRQSRYIEYEHYMRKGQAAVKRSTNDIELHVYHCAVCVYGTF